MDQTDHVRYQLDVAEANEKAIIAIRPFGQDVDVPLELEKRAHEIVAWNQREIADAVRKHARLEETTRWDVIDFP